MRATKERQVWLARHVIQHEPALRRWLRGRLIVGMEVDDIVQETYGRLVGAKSVDHILNVRNYVFQTAHSVIVSHIRKSRIVYLHSMDEVNSFEVPDDDPSPEAHVMHRQELARLLQAIIALPDNIRAVFLARRVDGLPQRTVAATLSIPESTVEMRMRRANLLLARSLSENGNSDETASKGVSSHNSKIRLKRDTKTPGQ